MGKRVQLQIDDSLHMTIKMTATSKNMSMKDYILELINNDLKEISKWKMKECQAQED